MKYEWVLVLDRSGSMVTIIDEARSGVRELMSRARGRVQVVLFNDKVETWERCKPAEMRDLGAWRPAGMTALYDGIMTGCKRAAEVADKKRAVHLVIATDGVECPAGCSEARPADVRKALEDGKAEGWTVTYIGANQDAVLTAQNLGLSPLDAATYAPTGQGIQSAFRGVQARSMGLEDWQSTVRRDS